MMRIRMPNDFARSEQLRAIAELSRRLGNGAVDITTRQQIELRSLQTGLDNVRNINGCPLAGSNPHELLDASPVVQDLDRIIVGEQGNPQFTNLPRKFNITVTGCPDNCTHTESQDIALVPARKAGRTGFNVLVGGKMGSGGFTVASPLNVFVEAFQAVPVVVELIKIYRDHGPREARSKCRFAFLIEEWGLSRLRPELIERLGHELAFQGRDMRSSSHADHLGVTRQRQEGLRAVGLCVPTGRVNPEQLDELARLAAIYGNGEIRLTTAQNAVIPHIPADAVGGLLAEPLLKQFSPRPSPFLRNMVACVGTDYCNLALIETKGRAVALSEALDKTLGSRGNPLTCPDVPPDVETIRRRILAFVDSRPDARESSWTPWPFTRVARLALTRLPAKRFWKPCRAMRICREWSPMSSSLIASTRKRGSTLDGVILYSPQRTPLDWPPGIPLAR